MTGQNAASDHTSDFDKSVASENKKKKRKVRIKYRQRVKLKTRPKGSRFKLFWKRNTRKIKTALLFGILAALLGTTLYVVVRIGKQQGESKRQEWNELPINSRKLE